MKPWSGTARRLFVAFAVLIVAYAIASAIAFRGLLDMRAGLASTKQSCDGVRLALDLASAVRDQYAHQAHTIIIGNASHVGLYSEAEQRVLAITGEVRKHVQTAEERKWADDIDQASARLDQIFRADIVPAVLSGKRADIVQKHGEAQQVVSFIQRRADQLSRAFEASIDDTQARLGAVEARVSRWAFVFLAGGPLLAIGVGLWVGRSVAVPVSRLREGAARLAAGDMDARIDIDRPDEFGALASQFNAMTTALKDNQQKLIETEKLAGIGRLAAGVAHEINNPLGVILGYAKLLRKKSSGSVAEELAIIEQETLRCQEIVEGLLDLSRPMNEPSAPVDLRDLCEDVVGRLAESRQLDGVAVTVEGEGTARGQVQKLRQVVLNLVKNAAESAGPGGRVELRIDDSSGVLEVRVADSGPGIAENARSHLFEPFFTTKSAGTGLGLAVSRAIVRAHGGDIVAGSAPRLGGALFTVRLPISPSKEGA